MCWCVSVVHRSVASLCVVSSGASGAISAVNHASMALCGDWGLPRRVSFTYHLPGEVKDKVQGGVSISARFPEWITYIQQVCLFIYSRRKLSSLL